MNNDKDLNILPKYDKYENKFGKFGRPSFEYIWMKNAFMIAERSTCLRKKVGVVIVDSKNYNWKSFGYNGSLPGEENGCKTLDPGKCGCIHAEINALKKINKDDDNLTMFITLSPCIDCANAIINNNKIKKIIYYKAYRDISGIKLLHEHDIEIINYNNLIEKDNKL